MSELSCKNCGETNAPVFIYIKDEALIITAAPDTEPTDVPWVYHFCSDIECLKEWVKQNCKQAPRLH